MGYDTTLIFVEDWQKKFKSYCRILATVDLAKVGCDNFGDLISKCQKPNRYQKQIVRYDKLVNEIEDLNYSIAHEKDVEEYVKTLKALQKELKQIEAKLEEKCPFIYYESGNIVSFSDRYSEPLMIASLEDVREAIIRDQAKTIHKKEYDGIRGYRRYNTGLALVEHFLDTDQWVKGTVRVVLWGH